MNNIIMKMKILFFVMCFCYTVTKSVVDIVNVKSDEVVVQDEEIINRIVEFGVVDYLNFLKEKDFLKILNKLPSITNSIFNISSAITSIGSNLSSTAIKLVKKELERLYQNIYEWRDKFTEIKGLVDWNSLQVDFEKIENSIISSYNFPDLSNNDKNAEIDVFIDKYENEHFLADNLYLLLTNNQIDTQNLLKAVQVSMLYHRNQVREFMIGMLQLLTQAIQIEAIYMDLKTNNSKENRAFMKSLWNVKLEFLKKKMEECDDETTTKYETQYEIDLDEMLKTRKFLTNEQFSSVLYNMLSNKYDWRKWFVLVYKELSGFKNHAVNQCSGTYRFRTYGRNVIVSSVNENEAIDALSNIADKFNIIGSYDGWNFEKEYSKGWVSYVRNIFPKCQQAHSIASVAWGSDVWYISTSLIVYRKNCVNNKSPCYNTFIFA